MGLTSNEKRALQRQQCREALVAHIYDRLGLDIAPNQVRLQPSMEDGYAWSVTESSAWLLQSNLGTGNLVLYRTICDELGRSLEAVKPQALQESQSIRSTSPERAVQQTPCHRGNESFTETIHRLQRVGRDLSTELDRTHRHLDEVLGERRECQAQIRRLQEELENSRSLATRLEDELVHMRADVVEAMQVLQKSQHCEREVSCQQKNQS